MHLKSILAATALALALGGAAFADTLQFTAALKGASETPPNDSQGSGLVVANLDTATKAFSYTVTYSGLTGPAVAAHFHVGAPGVAGPPTLPVHGALASPVSGTAILTDAQIGGLEAGTWYFNIHTAAHPSGEVRGQLTKQ